MLLLPATLDLGVCQVLSSFWVGALLVLTLRTSGRVRTATIGVPPKPVLKSRAVVCSGIGAARSALALALLAYAGLAQASTTTMTSGSTFTVPAGVTQIVVKIKGGAGGGGGMDSGPGGNGGSATEYTAVLNVAPNDVLSAVVGQGGPGGITGLSSCPAGGGASAGGSGPPAGGRGGDAGCGGFSGGGAGGGGASSLVRSGVTLFMAAGSGGAAGSTNSRISDANGGSPSTTPTSSASCAPGAVGGAGQNGSTTDTGGGGGGGGGFLSGAGGTAAISNSNSAFGGAAGTSCASTQAGLFATATTGSNAGGGGGAGSAAQFTAGATGAAGSVQIIIPELTIRKTWGVNSMVNDKVTITATNGGASSANVVSTVLAGGNTTTGSTLPVTVGNTIGLPAETFNTGLQANYTTSVSCNNAVLPVSTTFFPASFVVNAADANVVCTYTNTLRATFWDVTPQNNGQVNGSNGVIGTWDASITNWTQSTGTSNGAWAGGFNVATFQATGGAVNVSGTPSMGGLTFKSNGYTLSGSSLIGAAGTNILTADPGISATVSNVLTGNAFNKSGGGTIVLSAANTYTGATSINGGILVLSSPSWTTYVGGPININNGSTLQVTQTGGFNRYDFAAQVFNFGILGGGSITGMPTVPALNWVLMGPWTFNSVVGAKNTVSGAINLNSSVGNNIVLNVALGSDPITDLNMISSLTNNGNSVVTKTGNGRATLGGANDYGGATNVNAGTLIANNNAALGATGVGTSVASAATLALPGGITIGAEALSLSGTGVSSVGALSNTAGLNTYGGAITLAAASTIGSTLGTLTLSNTVNNGGFGLTLNGAGAITANGVISGTGALTKTGTGTATLNGTNSYSGATNVNAGILIAGNATALGTTAAGTTVASGATLALPGAITIGAEALTLSGTGVGAAGALSNTIGANTYGGAITLAAATTIGSTAGTLTLSNTVNNDTFGLTLDGAGNITAGGVISGTGTGITLTKTGSGIALLNVANTYAGTTTVSGGTLKLGATTNALPTGTAVSVASGATLDVNDKTQNIRSVTSSGTVALGTTAGNLTLTNGASSIASITGKGTIAVGPGATLTLTSALNNTGVNIVLAGGTLNLGVLTHNMGTLSLTQASTLDFASAGTAQLTAATLDPAFALNVTNWTHGTDHFFASAVAGNPARNTTNLSPLNSITLTGRSPLETAWLSSNEIVALPAPPTISKVFSPTTVGTGVSSVLTITLSNQNATALTAAAFTDTYPGGLINSATPSGTTTCGSGTVTAAPGGSSVALSGGTISANNTCTVTVNVTSNTAGAYTNTIAAGALSSSGGSNVAAISAILTVTGGAISGRVFFDNGAGSGAVANDGILNGTEAPQASITMSLSNCSGTVYSSTLTDGSGNYFLTVPSSMATGAPLCVAQTNKTGRLSTGASFGSTALPDGAAILGFTYTRTTDSIAFAFSGTSQANLNFADVDSSAFAASGTKTSQAGSSVSYPHTFTAQTAGSITFSVATSVSSPTLAGWSEKIVLDAGCTGVLQAGAAVLYPTVVSTPVTAGQQVCVIVQEFIPSTAQNGYSNDIKVQVSLRFSNASPALTAIYTLDDVTRVSISALELKKEVRNVTQNGVFGINNQAKSGETLQYRITYTNNGISAVTSLSVSAATPSYTTFVSAAAGTTPAGLTACQMTTPANPAPANATVACSSTPVLNGTSTNAGTVSYKFTGALNPSDTGTVLFNVKVD